MRGGEGWRVAGWGSVFSFSLSLLSHFLYEAASFHGGGRGGGGRDPRGGDQDLRDLRPNPRLRQLGETNLKEIRVSVRVSKENFVGEIGEQRRRSSSSLVFDSSRTSLFLRPWVGFLSFIL